jgi:predicted GIY-YIG superfamily endonuclease
VTTAAALEDMPHYVYRYYDADGQALYIGCTFDVARRERQHRYKEWFPLVARRVIDQFPNKFAGRSAEEVWIQREQPIHNVQRKYEPQSGDPLWFEIKMLIAAEPHRIAEILDRYGPAINDRINASYEQAALESKQWKRTRRRLRESQYRAARRAHAS